MPKAIDLTGERYGMLQVVGKSTRGKGVESFFICKCDCGKIVEVRSRSLKVGDNISCGCKKKQFKHGLEGTPLYRIWNAMIHRCKNEKQNSYKNYGMRGITVCDEWEKSVKSFVLWAESNGWRDGLQIDRADNDGPYSPENCRFVTPAINCRNRRSNVLTESMVEAARKRRANGETYISIAMDFGCSRNTISSALRGITWA